MPFAALNTTWFAVIGLLLAATCSRRLRLRSSCRDAVHHLRRDGPSHVPQIRRAGLGRQRGVVVGRGRGDVCGIPSLVRPYVRGFYLALFLVLVALIFRGVSFKIRGKEDRASWRRTWDIAEFQNLMPAVVWGVAFPDLVHGVPASPGSRCLEDFSVCCIRSLWWAGWRAWQSSAFTVRCSCLSDEWRSCPAGPAGCFGERCRHGSAARSDGGMAHARFPGQLSSDLFRLRSLSLSGSPRSSRSPGGPSLPTRAKTVGVRAYGCRHSACDGSRVLPDVPVCLPRQQPRSQRSDHRAAASLHNTLVVMTIMAAIFTPIMLGYQGWTYWVSRQRLVRDPGSPSGATASDRPIRSIAAHSSS